MSGLVRVSREGGQLTVALNRPESRNALSSALLAELTESVRVAAGDDTVRVLVLAGEGRDFCAGADLNDMKALGSGSLAENRADAQRLGAAFAAIHGFPRPVVARVQGNVFGGGVGLVAAADVAIIARDARLAFSEVRLGILPAVISPYVVRRIGEGAARRLFLTGERFTGEDAVTLGLASRAVDAGELDAAVGELVELLLLGSPDAQRRIKQLLDEVSTGSLEAACGKTPGFIADARASDEGQEGLRAFLEKRPPSWHGE
ncbi:MAG: methylglutaconyl-CoA hydratase [Gemmatimonadota bacterium]|nr:MAG: methylglutaconyl-CoA hydratase [Gemmatimonadota bacterium]